MSKLLEVNNLKIGFADVVVDDVSFAIDRGEVLALVGESGSGKSVSALSVLQLLPLGAAKILGGEVLFNGKDLLHMDLGELQKIRGNKIAMIFQEPMTSLNPLHTIEQQIGESILLHNSKLKKQDVRVKILDLLEQVGIKDAASRLASYPHELSGGQRQRVMIACALANEPELLIADEPTTALDVTVQAQILELLKDLQVTKNLAMLFISHDLNIVKKFAQKICVMKDGRIVEHGAVAEIFASPSHPYTQALINAEPSGTPPVVLPSASEIMVGENVKVWFPIKHGFLRRTHDYIKAVDEISLAIKQGETLGIVGESGSGKTTLGLALARMIASQGRIAFADKMISDYSFSSMKKLRQQLQIVFQDPYGSLSPRMSVAEIVGEGLDIHFSHLSENERDEKTCAVLTEVGLDVDSRHRYPHEFSGGQRQRIAIARALILEPKFLMLDEPTSALDRQVQAQVVELLLRLQKSRQLSYLFISHDLKIVRAMASRVIVMRGGKIIEQGEMSQVFNSPRHDYTKQLMAAAFE